MLEEILELHRDGQLDEAEARYREQLVFNPDDPETLHLLGILRRQRGDVAEALMLVRRAHELNAERPTYLMTLAGIELHTRQLDASETHFKAALALDPNLTSAYSALGQIAMMRGDAGEAERLYKVALAAGDERVDVLSGYGGLLLRRGETEMALRYYTRAVDLAPKDPMAQAGLARTYMARGMHAFAEQVLRNLIAQQPGFHVAHRLLAEALLLQKRNEDAREVLTPLMSVEGERAAAIATLGDVARTEGDFRNAVLHYRQSLEADRNQPRVIEAMAWCLMRMGMTREAIGAYRSYLEHAPNDVDALRALAHLMADFGQPLEAAEIYRRALDAGGDDAGTRQGLAVTLEMSGDLAGAEAEASRALEQYPEAVGASQVLARARLRQDDALGASALLATLPGESENPAAYRSALLLRGRTFDALGSHAEAVAAWRETHRLRVGESHFPSFTSLSGPLSKALEFAAERGVAYAGRAPRALLIGAPGSGVELVAALLADAAPLLVMGDRFSASPRSDLFTQPEFPRYLELDETDARIVARHYERPLQRMNAPEERGLIDWLPHWDAGWLPAIHRLFGSIPLIVAGRDPRDALLQWLALGSPHGLSAADPVAAARWLRSAYEHVLWARDHARLPVVGVDAVSLLEDPTSAARRIATALGIDEFAPGASFARARVDLGGLQPLLPRGRYRAYESELGGAFAELTPLLSQFGGA